MLTHPRDINEIEVGRLSLHKPPALPHPPGVPVRVRFGIRSLLVVIALLCAPLALMRSTPPLGLMVLAFVIVVVVPAMLRSTSQLQANPTGRPMSRAERETAFVDSLGVVLMLWVAGVVAFGTCLFVLLCLLVLARVLASFNSDLAVPLGLLCVSLSLVFAAAFVVWAYVKTWPRA